MKTLSLLCRSSALLFALTSLPLLGCAAEEGSETADPTAPIAILELPNGNQVEFYEPSPGILLVSELGKGSAAAQSDLGGRPLDLYRALAPGTSVPAALIAAQDRADARPTGAAPALEEAAPAPVANVVAPKTQGYIDNHTIDDRQFDLDYCRGDYDYIFCSLNREGNMWLAKPSVNDVRYRACADIGTITMKVAMGDGSGINLPVQEGYCRNFPWDDPCPFGCNESTRIDILDVGGSDRYHFSARINF